MYLRNILYKIYKEYILNNNNITKLCKVGKKPLTFGYTKAIKKMGLEKKNVAAVGDQIFTDVLGSNLKGIRSVFVFPIELETGFWFRVKRKIEKFFLPKNKTN